MQADVVQCGDVRLKVFHSIEDRDLPTIMFVNAVGMPAASTAHMAAEVRRAGFNFLTWELRGSPGPSRDERDCASATHAADALHIVNELGIRSVHLMGWCTGAAIGLFVSERLGVERVKSFVAVDGAYLFDGVPGAPLGNAMYAMCGEITEDPSVAQRYYELTRSHGREATVLGLEHAPELVEYVTYPYRHGVEELVRFAFGIRSATAYDPVEMWSKVRVPTFISARRDDRMVSYRNSTRACEHAPGSRFRLFDEGGHYALFTDEAALAEITAFAAAVERASHGGNA